MATMTDAERDAFLAEPHLGILSIAREDKGPLVAPIWYRYEPGRPVEMCMGSSSAKAHRLRAEGRATLAVVDASGGRYRYVTIEGAVRLEPLGDRTRSEILAMSTRYLGVKGGQRYTDNFMAKLEQDDLHDGHGTEEVLVQLTPERWRTDVL